MPFMRRTCRVAGVDITRRLQRLARDMPMLTAVLSPRCNAPSSGVPRSWSAYEEKMVKAGCSGCAVAAFKANFAKLASGDSLMIGEDAIMPVRSLPSSWPCVLSCSLATCAAQSEPERP